MQARSGPRGEQSTDETASSQVDVVYKEPIIVDMPSSIQTKLVAVPTRLKAFCRLSICITARVHLLL